MGTGMEIKMIRSAFGLCLSLFAALALTGCGSDPMMSNSQGGLPIARQLATSIAIQSQPRSDKSASPEFRKVLESAGTPFYRVVIAKMQYAGIMAPFGQNGNVVTWSSSVRQTMSVRDGVLVATRGFGNDLMSALAPDIAEVSRGSGTFHRVYYYLDGADQSQSLAVDCSFARSGNETITLLGLSYDTHRVTEVCVNATTHIENTYWFDGSGKLRQSDQFLSPELAYMRLQRIID